MGLKLKQQESETLRFKSTLADLVKTMKKEIMHFNAAKNGYKSMQVSLVKKDEQIFNLQKQPNKRNEFSCGNCEYKTETRDELFNHMKSVHKNYTLYDAEKDY